MSEKSKSMIETEDQGKLAKTAYIFPMKSKESCLNFKEKFGINLVPNKVMLMCVIISPQHLPTIMIQPPPPQLAPAMQQAWVFI